MLLFFELKEKIIKSQVIKDKIILLFIFLGLLVNVVIWYYLYSQSKVLGYTLGTEIIPLHYNIYFGIDYIGPANKLYTLPSLGLMILIINIILSFFLYIRSKLLSYFLMIFAFINQVILFFSLFLIILFNK